MFLVDKILIVVIAFSNGDLIHYEFSDDFLFQYSKWSISSNSQRADEIFCYSLVKNKWFSATKQLDKWVANSENQNYDVDSDETKYFDVKFKNESTNFNYKNFTGRKMISSEGAFKWVTYYLEIEQLKKLNPEILKFPIVRFNKYVLGNLYRVEEKKEVVKPIDIKAFWTNDFSEQVRNRINFETIEIIR